MKWYAKEGTFHNQELRAVNLEGNPWFVAADVCRCLNIHMNILGQANVTVACSKLNADETSFYRIETSTQSRKVRIISESGLYKLIMRSDKKEARVFQDWVTKDVSIQLTWGRTEAKDRVG